MKVFPIIALVSLALVASSLAGGQERLSVPYEEFTLANGLTVIVHEDRLLPIATVNMWYHVGSGNEKRGRTGFAHLFEHIMFEGSANVPEGKFDEWLEAAGGTNNGSTNVDRTNYYEDIPSNALELAIFLEADRMGKLLDAMSPGKVDGQRDVVKNERRQSYENRPYGLAWPKLMELIYPPNHPYSWPTIGSMEDLSAASYEDVVDFFKTYYTPGNASLVVAGDVDADTVRALAEKWFGNIPAGKPSPLLEYPPFRIDSVRREVMEDKVQLPRLHLAWQSPPGLSPGDAELDVLASILTGGKNSRLYKKLVYEMQIAQDVSAFQNSSQLGGEFMIIATARAGHTLPEIEAVIQEELKALMTTSPPTGREVERAVNGFESSFIAGLERVGGFGGKANQLNSYYFRTGNPDYFNEDLGRYRALDPDDIGAAAAKIIGANGFVSLSIVPEGKRDLAEPKPPATRQ